jgi:hypothetical protein
MGDVAGAEEARKSATEVIDFIASNVKDENLRNTFLKSASSALIRG